MGELTLKDFKGLDLGGRDCGTIAKVLAGKVSLDKMPKFVGRIALMTGGSLFTRTRLATFAMVKSHSREQMTGSCLTQTLKLF